MFGPAVCHWSCDGGRNEAWRRHSRNNRGAAILLHHHGRHSAHPWLLLSLVIHRMVLLLQVLLRGHAVRSSLSLLRRLRLRLLRRLLSRGHCRWLSSPADGRRAEACCRTLSRGRSGGTEPQTWTRRCPRRWSTSAWPSRRDARWSPRGRTGRRLSDRSRRGCLRERWP